MQMPDRVHVHESSSEFIGKFTMQPLEEGYGVTIGNALRRVLLASIPGSAIIAVNISGVLHEFQTIKGVTEDVCEMILNLKGVRLRQSDKKMTRVSLHLKGPYVFTARDIQEAGDAVEVMNQEHYIATLAKDADLKIDLYVGRGNGYVPAEENRNPEYPANTIAIDSIFTPIKNVKYTVEPFRVGQKTDYEKLILDVETDGTISAEDGVAHAARIMRDHIQLFINFEPPSEEVEAEVPQHDAEAARLRRILLTPVDELELSVRSHNCLKAANIRILADLVRRQEADMLKFRNFGRKSLSELTGIVASNNLVFGMDVERYLTEDDIKAVNQQ